MPIVSEFFQSVLLYSHSYRNISVTSVGGTSYSGSETAAPLSGGGFRLALSNYYHELLYSDAFPNSNIFPIPSYQSSVVASYVAGLGSTYSGLYNGSGRGVPDVAAIAEKVEVIFKGSADGASGTSCASPIFASVISLINDELIAAGKSPLGFLNPFVYANPTAFTDVTSGSNPGCSTNGFSAGAGWDPVTGLGSPIYSNIKAAAGL